jgi:hypothetical protein
MLKILTRAGFGLLSCLMFGTAIAQQGGITLAGSNATLCHSNNTSWSIGKTGQLANGVATWTVNVTKGATTSNSLGVYGYVDVTNTGNAPATIGNIIVNLQKQVTVGRKTYWISAAANVANATAGDAATSAKFVKSATQEDAALNASNGPVNYSASGQQGTFSEGAGSGSLEFTDANNSTVFSITPQLVLAPSQTVRLLYKATFDNTVLNIAPGKLVRSEAIVTFGNAGARGGSGSSASNIDIDGSGGLTGDEANVRSVPTRITNTVPALEECNSSVTLTDADTDVTTTGTVTFSNFNNGGIGTGVVLTGDAQFTVTADVDGGASGGTITNTAHLNGAGDQVGVITGYDPITFLPIYYYFDCCIGVDLPAASTLNVAPTGFVGWTAGEYVTYDKGGFAGGGGPGIIMNLNYGTVFSATGLTIGINDGTNPLHHAQWGSNASGLSTCKTAMGGGGTPGALTSDTFNATSISGGALTKHLIALTLNVAFNDANVMLGTLNPSQAYGDLYYVNPADPAFDGKTIRQILADVNSAVGTGIAPAGHNFSTLDALVSSLNGSFLNGTVSGFAAAFIRPTP